MFRKSTKQLLLDDFFLPFGGELDPNNRWIILSSLIPWGEVENIYAKNFISKTGCPAKSARMAFAALIIKERLGATDEDSVEHILENPYLQYFLGLSAFCSKTPPFEASMYVHFRKRFSLEVLNQINERIVQDANKSKEAEKETHKDGDGDGKAQSQSTSSGPAVEPVECKGKLLIDATCTPADIHFPTDVNVLDSARKKSEEIIDCLYPFSALKKKPRTYRKVARKRFLEISMSKRVTRAKRRKAIRKQLGFLKRNLSHIDRLRETALLTTLSKRQYKNLLVIHEVYRQQKQMYDQKSHSVENRIVSVSQPHVRPIVRGKLGKKTEFGAKISASVVDGYCFLDRVSWEAYNETVDLVDQLEYYRNRFGYYPEVVCADRIYRTRKNRDICKALGVRLAGPPLGRPSKDKEKTKSQRRTQREDEIDRIPIEGKFGEGKRRFSLGRIMAKLSTTSECVIGIAFVVMNLEKCLRDIFLPIFTFISDVFTGVYASQGLRWKTLAMGMDARACDSSKSLEGCAA